MPDQDALSEAAKPRSPSPTPAEPSADSEETPPGRDLIAQLEQLIGSRVLVYFGTSRSEIEDIDVDAVYAALSRMGPQGKIAVILETPGGNADVAFILMSLLREYAKAIDVYILRHAASAGTIFSLAADRLVMGPPSMLGPIDPQVPLDVGMLVPTREADKRARLGRVEAHIVRDFLEFAGVLESERDRPRCIVDRLAQLLDPHQMLNPFQLGWYESADKVSRFYAREGLLNHLLAADGNKEATAEVIIKALLHDIASHNAGILRGVALRIGIPVESAPDDVWTQLEALEDHYLGAVANQGMSRILETTEYADAHWADEVWRMCANCEQRQQVDLHVRFCVHCGVEFEPRCAGCERVIDKRWAFCGWCGTVIA